MVLSGIDERFCDQLEVSINLTCSGISRVDRRAKRKTVIGICAGGQTKEEGTLGNLIGINKSDPPRGSKFRTPFRNEVGGETCINRREFVRKPWDKQGTGKRRRKTTLCAVGSSRSVRPVILKRICMRWELPGESILDLTIDHSELVDRGRPSRKLMTQKSAACCFDSTGS